jgi:hypothetical protein
MVARERAWAAMATKRGDMFRCSGNKSLTEPRTFRREAKTCCLDRQPRPYRRIQGNVNTIGSNRNSPNVSMSAKDTGRAASHRSPQKPGLFPSRPRDILILRPNLATTDFMDAPNDLELRSTLARLREDHRDLDAAIAALEMAAIPDRIQLQRLKKRKLSIKDQLTRLEALLVPDIIA